MHVGRSILCLCLSLPIRVQFVNALLDVFSLQLRHAGGWRNIIMNRKYPLPLQIFLSRMNAS